MSELFRWKGSLAELASTERADLLDRSTSSDDAVRERTAAIVARVRNDGDAALIELGAELDGVALQSLAVPAESRLRALATLDAPVRAALERAAANIEAVHRAFLPRTTELEVEAGIVVGRRPDPLDSVGVYAPGGRAAYPSSVLMGVVPARVAGVKRIVLCSPPGADGLPSQVVLAAGELAGVSEVYAIGGAGAIAAMAYGTRSIAPVRRIVGPGNAYVAEAKLQVSGITGIDSPAGPSELLVIADDSVSATSVARELLAQAEHDPRAACVVIAVSGTRAAERAREIGVEVAALLEREPRREIIEEALATRGAILWSDSLDEAIAFSNDYAPEHLLLALRDTDDALERVRNAGTVFLGTTTSVAFGDYMTGANHVLPTGGLARSYSGLSTLDFVRWTTYQRVSASAARDLAPSVATLAEREGLPAHAAAAREAGSVAQSSEEQGSASLSRGQARARATLRDLSLYRPHRPPCALDLSDNTNRWGVPPFAALALEELSAERVSRYPAVYTPELKEALSQYAGVRADEVVIGCGSDDILDSAIRAFAEPGDVLAYPDPTFGMLPIWAQMNGLVSAPSTSIDALLTARARVTYICSPNNPTGIALTHAEIQRVVDEAAGIVILDEAYAEFADDPWIARAPHHPRLIVARTMSKAFGLAGLRIGYATGSAHTVLQIEKARGPYMVSAAAERATLAALNNDLEWVRTNIAAAKESRARLGSELDALGIASIPSSANFIFVPVESADEVATKMRAAGVAVRPFAAVRGLGDGVRITIAPWPMMETALGALREAMKK